MKGIELINWIKKERLENGEVYVNGANGYEKVDAVWESEKDGGAVIIETGKRKVGM